MKTNLSILAVSVLATIPLVSSIANDNIPVQDEIVVTAKSNQTLRDVLPTSHVFTAIDIQASQAQDIPSLISQISGISTNDSGSRGSVSSTFIRGAKLSQITVLVDGVRIGSASLGAATLNAYPIEAIERIEVIKGPLSGLYGADAIGGVIQIFTKKNGHGLGSGQVTIGSDNLLEYGVSFNGGDEKNGFRVSAHAEELDGIDSTTILVNGNDDDDGFEETAFSFAGNLTLSDNTTVQLSVLSTDNESEFDNTFPFGETDDTAYLSETKTLSSALTLITQLSKSTKWTTTLGHNKDEANTPIFSSEIESDRNSLATEIQHLISDKQSLTVGIDYYEEEINSNTDYIEPERDNKSIYAQWQNTFGNVGLMANLRHDDNSAYGSDSNGNAAISYNFTDDVRATLSYGTAFAAPGFNDLYYPFFGNPNLLAEESESTEISVLGQHEHWNWRMSAYQTDIDNLIGFDPVSFTAANTAEAELKGVEFEFGFKLSNWLLDVNLDFLSAEDKQTGIELDDRVERTLTASASRGFGQFDLRFDFKSEDGRHDNSGTELDSHALLDISGAYKFNDKLSASAKVTNVFDKDYVVNLIGASNSYNTEDRQFKVSLKYQF